MAITRTAIIDDDGTGNTGTVFEDLWKQELYDQIDAEVAAVAAALAATIPATPVAVNKGGTGVATLTNHGVLLGPGTAAVAVSAAGTAGQVLTSNGASADPTWQDAGGVDRSLCQGRLTLTSGLAVTPADVAAATSIYWTPFVGNQIALYDGSAWQLLTFSELTLALGTMTAGIGYDVFAYINAGVVAIEKVAWNSATARHASGTYASVHPLQDGVKVKSTNGTAIDATRRYLGAFYALTTTTTEDSAANRLLSNYYNLRCRPIRRLPTTDTWTYTTNTFRQANADGANQVAVFVGVAEVALQLSLEVLASNNGTGNTIYVAFGEDSTTTPATGCRMTPKYTFTVTGAYVAPAAMLVKNPAIGYHFYAWLEKATAGGSTTWRGDGGGGTDEQSGIGGFIEG